MVSIIKCIAKTVNCPGCGEKITAEIDTKIESAKIFCPGCGAKVWVSMYDIPPQVYAECLDPVAEAVLAQVLPHAVGR